MSFTIHVVSITLCLVPFIPYYFNNLKDGAYSSYYHFDSPNSNNFNFHPKCLFLFLDKCL